jgi:Na+-transporting methylmalonyl-CoA/oxaloacetate decarboxylase beta subunit
MNIERKKNLRNIIIEIILMILVIIAINIIPENNNISVYVIPESSAVGIIGSFDGPTTIFVGREFNLMNFFKNLILGIMITSLSILLIIDIIGFIKSKKYKNRYRLKIVSSIDIFLIIMYLLYSAFPMFGLRITGISVILNIVLLTTIFIKEILLKIIRHENKGTKEYEEPE